MIEKRSLSIHSKVIYTNDLVQLANLFNNIYEELLNKHENDIKNKNIPALTPKPSITFNFMCDDKIEYSSDSLELFYQDSIVYNRVFTRIGFRINYYQLNYEIRLSLSNNQYLNDLEVQGSSSSLVESTFQKINDFITRLEHQESKIKNNRWLIAFILSIMPGWILGTIIYFILNHFINDLNPSVYYFCSLGGSICTIFFLALDIADYLSDLWPDIEIVPSPEHKRVLHMKRRRLSWLFSAIMIPFLISLIVALIVRS